MAVLFSLTRYPPFSYAHLAQKQGRIEEVIKSLT